MRFFALQELGQERLDHMQWAVEVDVHYVSRVLVFQFVDLDEWLDDAGVVDDRVDAAESFDYLSR